MPVKVTVLGPSALYEMRTTELAQEDGRKTVMKAVKYLIERDGKKGSPDQSHIAWLLLRQMEMKYKQDCPWHIAIKTEKEWRKEVMAFARAICK
ncbi:MAG: hypothetical protein COY40_01230 [Alphaproteobacteria bacterium CG_4_10_14_0_8_um_filter_53_9]|nr:MAG: hypothetical protein COY40_01230 [Alphaproteobacteria bacterium CG_4_10_14_0_8_um_filter_53_9]